MKFKLNLNAEVQKLAGNFGFNDGEGKFNCDLEVEYSVEEFLELVKIQKEIVPGILNFVKEMQELTSKQNYDSEKEFEIEKLKNENARLRREKGVE